LKDRFSATGQLPAVVESEKGNDKPAHSRVTHQRFTKQDEK